MKISHKLTLVFSAVIILILLSLGSMVYFFSAQYRQSEFYNRLRQRIDITEKLLLEKDNFSTEEKAKIQEQFLNKLPEETEEVLMLTPDFRDNLTERYPGEFLTNLLEKKEAYFEEGRRQGAGKIFHVHNSDYLVLLTAVDHIGIRMMDHLRTVIVITLAVCILVVSFVSYFISGSLLNPVSMKIQMANSISASNLHERLTVYNPDDEIGELAIAFNNLLDRVAQAFEAQRQFIDNASHEIRNPLTAIIGETEYALEKERSKEDYVDSLTSVALEADRLNSLVNNLLQLSNINNKQVSFNKELIDMKELLVNTREKLDFLCPGNKVKLNFETNGSLSEFLVEGNNHLLETAFINLLDNASKFSFLKEVDVFVAAAKDNQVTVSIHDKGVGIPENDLAKVTQPFHRAANVRQIKGTGIGIPLTLKIIELHHGTFNISSTLNVGTDVRVTLPLLRA